jgi:hypothetical protein
MISVVEHGGRIQPKKDRKGGILFDSMRPTDLVEATHWVWTIRSGGALAFGKRRPTYVRMRGPDTYRSLEPLLGFEVRFLPTEGDPRLNRAFLDRVQDALAKDHFGIDPERLKAWMERNNLTEEALLRHPSLLAGHWYNQSWDVIARYAPPELRAFTQSSLRNPLQWWRARRLRRAAKEYEEIKMLFYDWSGDFLVFDRPELASRIRKSQLKALGELRAGGRVEEVMQNFLRDSGLYERTLGSL